MGLLFRGVFVANTRRKVGRKFELAELATDARAVAAADDAEIKFLCEKPDDAARACKQRRVFQFVGAGPEAVGCAPFGARKPRGTIDAQPVGGVVQR